MNLTTEGLVREMQTALAEAYKAEASEKGPEKELPDHSADACAVLFTAIARGLLKYLDNNEKTLIQSIQFNTAGGATWNVVDLNLNITP